MNNHWTEKIRLNNLYCAIDNKLSEAYSKGGTLGDFFFNLTPEEMEFLMNLKITDGAMCQDGYEFSIAAVNPAIECPFDWSEIFHFEPAALIPPAEHDYVG